ncbi:metal ABC transporter ATP-binding protein [Sporomusa acidovorans]|uniref:Zinc import ATP-binding protein ZnuC n=1 Tax=Sporomusa acidovorans (strain ATCC 49682 / DSM 3132 / Mol) TaxID=1123286 RepID=A0ABZ3J1V5_SPOA4|nr:metal ABC transporter ATP-binding protein [Sporomusa acidovorans]OZC24092.1 zinc import ATP-binding protein ZnuC [Sporomusa acidovorans DSM 3132]SDF68597.1 zinc transport system ATP-binding protein [Sporomusa acidovorans]
MTVSERHPHSCAENKCRQLCCTKIENFSVSFGGATVFQNVNLHIHCGELTAVIGPNGAGKSTLLKAILGEVKHLGTLRYFDAKGIRTGHPCIGYVPQYLNFDLSTPTSVLDLFMACLTSFPSWLTCSQSIRQRVRHDLAKVKAEHLIDRRLGALSGGELQRVLLALALDPIPDLLLMDEPVSGVDQNGLELFYNMVSDLRANHDLSIILVSHDLSMVAKYADRVVLLDGTVVCNGTPAEVFNDERTKNVFTMLLPYGCEDKDIPAKQKGGYSC